MPTLFCGVQLTLPLQNSLAQLPTKLYTQYIGPDSGHLLTFELDQTLYLGKSLNQPCFYADLELVETNLLSILKKLIPDINTAHYPVLLLSVEHELR